MKKFLLLTLTIVVACATAMAAPVDAVKAQQKATQFLTSQASPLKNVMPSDVNATLIKTEMGEKATTPVYYIFNTTSTFVIVSGDDRAEDILFVGDAPLNLDRMPENMKAWLDGYKEQLDWLLCNPDAKVEKTSTMMKGASLKAISDVSPMLTCNWSQDAPYWNQCNFTYNNRSYQCYSGCPATSASQVLYYWKWPTSPVGPLASYTGELNDTYTYTYPALEATTFDWANMKDTYNSYTTAQGNAVATLMRYVGQAEKMDYGTSGSGISVYNAQNIVDMFTAFGYANTCRLVLKNNLYTGSQIYNDTQWANLIQTEMAAGRPVVFMATSSSSGHAFNIDGYRASDGKYHVNFGWAGSGNGYCAMNAFASQSTWGGSTETFNQNQQMVIGIKPTDDYYSPTIVVNQTSVAFEGYATQTYTNTIHVNGINLSGDITISKSGSNLFSVSPTTISAADAANGVDVTVTYAPTAAGNATGTLTFTSSGAETKTVNLSGTAQAATPALVLNSNTMSFSTGSNTPQVKTISLTGRFVTSDVTVSLTDPNNVFTMSLNNTRANGQTLTIPASSINETTPVEVRVTFNSANTGTFNGSVSLSSSGATAQTVQLTATADDSGTASDAYLDIAKYATIDDAGWTSSYVDNFYKYTEYPSKGVAWLTLSVYGAWTGYRYSNNAGPQKWISSNVNTNTSPYGSATWNAVDGDVYQGSSAYFTSATSRYFSNNTNNSTATRTITFNVKNTTAVKLYGVNKAATISQARRCSMAIYKCTNNNGTITPASTATATVYGSTTQSGTVNIEVTDLDPEEIYQVVVSTVRTNLYEIAFQTDMPSISASPSYLQIFAEPGDTETGTVNVTGKMITDNVTVTLLDETGYFSVPTTSLNVTDVLAETGANVNVTFNAPQEKGTYEAQLALASGTEIVDTVTIYGVVAEEGSAYWEYLDLAKYQSIGENSEWYIEDADNPYLFTIDYDNNVGWLTMPTYLSVLAATYDEQNWIGAYWSTLKIYGDEWGASDVFKGSGPYFGSKSAGSIGTETTTSQTAGTQTYIYYMVTNCTKAKATAYNLYTSATYPTWMQVIDMSDGSTVDDIESTDQGAEPVLESSNLDPTKIYLVAVGGSRCVIREVAFCTPVENPPHMPINVEADPGTTTADITWTPGANNEGWNMRYREYVDPAETNRNWNFAEESQADEFTKVDNNNDGYNWEYSGGEMVSYSYDNNTGAAITPDNWLITPKVKLGGSVSFYAAGATGSSAASYCSEVFRVYVYVGDTWTSVNQFTAVSSDVTTTNSWQQYTYDLSAYEGYGYIAIRHYNCNDQFILQVDDIEVTVPDPADAPDWIYVDNVTSPYTITDLEPETTYEVQVQGYKANLTTDWTESTLFTTLPIPSATLATIESTGKKGETYTISDELIAVYADAENGMLWCKDQGNASIAATTIISGQIDFMRDANMTGNDGQGNRAWDQSNWVMLKFPEATVENGIATLLNGAVGKKIAAGTITGKYIDNRNYTINVDATELEINGTADITMNVYCTANFLESNTNVGENTGFVGTHGDNYFFMNPKVQEVCEITYAMWDGEKFVNPDNTEVPGAFNVDFSRNGQTPTLQANKIYRFIAIVSRPPRLGGMIGADPSNNIVVMPTNLTGDSNIVTAINGIYNDGYREVVAVEYVNSTGLTSKKPFHGVNIVVTRYSDGSKTTVKKIFK